MSVNLYGIIGYPVIYSLSPLMHNAAFKALKIDAQYKRFEVKPEELGHFMKHFRREPDMRGLSVTIPHKVAIRDFLDEIDQLAEEIGAVNTVFKKNAKIVGTNTDWYGAVEPLKKIATLKGKKIGLLGSGGAARAIAYGLKKEKASVTILSRDMAKAQEIAEKYGFSVDSLKNIEAYKPDIVINATSAGMQNSSGEGENPAPKNFLKAEMIVYDSVYKPLITPLLAAASEVGCKIISGEKMLLFQGIKQFEIWTGKKAPTEIMRDALLKGLKDGI